MSKPKPIVVASDDCVVKLGGEDLHPHEGEWVEVLPGLRVGDWALGNVLGKLSVELDGLWPGNDADTEAKAQYYVEEGRRLEAHAEIFIDAVMDRLIDWNWTDDLGRPMARPPTAETLKKLRPAELYWLVAAIKGETSSAEKNESRPSQTTSSATPRRTSRS